MKYSLLLLATATGLLVSCSKNNNNSPVNNPTPGSFRVKTYSSNYGTTTYTYDAQGRLILKVFGNGAKSEYNYSTPNKVIESYYFSNGNLEGTGEFDLDANGLMIKEVYSDGPANLYTTDYDANKNVIKEVHNINGNISVLDYFYTNGNLDSMQYKTNGSLYHTTIYSYYTDKPDLLNNDIWGQGYEGYYGKHLLKKEQTRYTDGTTDNVWEYTYEYDSKGRVSKCNSKNGQNTEVSYYTYY